MFTSVDSLAASPLDDPVITGPILFEGVLQMLCQGVIFAQAVKYYDNPLDDTLRQKVYVFVLVGMSCLQSALSIYKLWHVLIQRHTWSSCPIDWSELFFNGLICSTCELWLIRRCWKATSRNMWVLACLAFIAVSTAVANVYLVSCLAVEAMATLDITQTVFAFSYWILGSLVLDCTVTSILLVWLWKSKTGLNYLDRALKHIIGMTWESALVPCISMVIAVALYHAEKTRQKNLVLLFILITGKLYVLGIFRAINSRPKLRERMHSDENGRRSVTGIGWDEEATVGSADGGEDKVHWLAS
ncbi:hypothetical protein K488DRAFT_42012 [Vararia minispora EC-137]|uniref:Uncharacterized protein n=1 Tax=Vararia minispora EC-137 TaxID=1314806 RepID=A0ACB8QWM4_9AGAM|nr:hypothetical protein K488DRAFT_42012 [Vararia minispora EC-137]